MQLVAFSHFYDIICTCNGNVLLYVFTVKKIRNLAVGPRCYFCNKIEIEIVVDQYTVTRWNTSRVLTPAGSSVDYHLSWGVSAPYNQYSLKVGGQQ